MTKRITAALLLAVMILTAAVGCADKTPEAPSTKAETAAVESVPSLPAASGETGAKTESEASTAASGGQTAEERVSVTGIFFPVEEIHIPVGGRFAVRARVVPDNATDRGVTYEVSDPGVFSYENGEVVGLAPGSAALKATANEDGYVCLLTVTVEKAPEPTETPTETPTKTPTATPAEPTKTPDPDAPVILIDAGHGFGNSHLVPDVGAGEGSAYYRLSEEQTGKGLYEADLNLQIALKLKKLFTDAGYRVIMTREDYVNEYLNISARAARAKEMGADLLISVHANAADNKDAHGARIYCNQNPEFAARMESRALAQSIMDSIKEDCPASFFIDYLSDGQKLAMLNGVGDIPCVLVETAFLTNEDDARLALDEAWQNAMARAIFNGVVHYSENNG